MDDLEKEFDLLLMDYEEGTISDSDLTRLRDMMKEHEKLRQLYVRHQMISATINKTELETISLGDLRRESPTEEKSVKKFPILSITSIAAAILIVAGVFFLNKSNTYQNLAEIGSLDGKFENAYVIRQNEKLAAYVGMPIFSEDKLVTSGTKVDFRYHGEETLVMVKNNSEIKFQTKLGAKQLFLEKGDIICDVAKQPQGKPMVIYTADAKATVLGTQFMLSSSSERTKLDVSEGSVKMEDKASKKSIEAKAGMIAKTDAEEGLRIKQRSELTDLKIDILILINSETEQAVAGLEELKDGSMISLSQLTAQYFNILVECDESHVGGVLFRFKGRDTSGKYIVIRNIERNQVRNKGTETISPFHILSDGGKYWRNEQPMSWRPVPGTYNLEVTPFGHRKAKSQLGEIYQIEFTVTE